MFYTEQQQSELTVEVGDRPTTGHDFFSTFYRAVFAVARYPSVYPSVLLSRWWIQMAEDIVKLFVRLCSPIVLVVSASQHRYPIQTGTPSAGAQNTPGVGKIGDFRRKSPFMG